MPMTFECSDVVAELLTALVDDEMCLFTDLSIEDHGMSYEHINYDEAFESGVQFREEHDCEDVIVQCYYGESSDYSNSYVLYYIGTEDEVVDRIKRKVIELVDNDEFEFSDNVRAMIADWDLQTIIKEKENESTG